MTSAKEIGPATGARAMTRLEAKSLRAGDRHYSAYVGAPENYDLMGASQFRLLTTLGLRDHHKVLDFGCGSLRVGRLLLPYLLPGNYFGIEPNAWLIEDAIANEIGNDQIKLKRPSFGHDSDFKVDGFGEKFDFILAQSIFSHCGRDLIKTALENFRNALVEHGIILATFVHVGTPGMGDEFKGTGWVYPRNVAYYQETIFRLFRGASLVGDWIPWHHSQQWYLMARNRAALPPKSKYLHLSGAVLRDPASAASS